MAGNAVLSWLKERNEQKMIATFDRNMLPQFGVQALQDHRDASGKQHAILHELVKKGKAQVLQHLVEHHGFDMNVQRETDGCTPLHLAHWHRLPDIVDLLIRLGADTSVQNNYGESAADLMNLPAQIRTRLQGVRTVQEVLQLFRSEAASFDDLDKVTAYYRISDLSAKYDVQFCRWDAAQNQLSPGDQQSLQRLARACVEALRRPLAPESDWNLWPTMMRALAMLPDVQVVEELLEMLTPEIVQTWSALNLCQVAWAMGKIRSTLQSRNIEILPRTQEAFLHVMRQLGNFLAPHVAEMSERNLAATVWAFGAAKVGQEEVGHQALCDAVAADLETRGANLVSAQSISNIAWAFAKLDFSSPGAFGQLEEAAIRLVGTFKDQNVANTLWSFAKLKLGTANLFGTLMRRADFTLYEDRLRHHDSMSDTVKLIHWFQVYYAYRFCLRRHPGALGSLTERLAGDLGRIHRSFPRDDSGLSIGSGLESAESLRELDQMIASSDQGEIPALPVDSMEAQPLDPEIAQIAAIATSGNDQVARNAMGSLSQLGFEEVKIVMLKFSRSDHRFLGALLEGEELQACRDALQEAGHQVVHASGAKIFVRPQHYQAVCERIQADEMRLFTSHVLVAEEFEDLVQAAVARIPSTRRGQASSSELAITSDRLQSDLTVESRSTFLHIPGAPNSLYSGSLPRGTRSAIV